MAQVLADHGLAHPRLAENWRDAETTSAETTALVVLGLETRLPDRRDAGAVRAGHSRRAAAAAAAAQARGRRADRSSRASRRAIWSCTSTTVSAGSSGSRPSRCRARRMTASRSSMRGNTKLYLPVENIELLSRYGADAIIELDKLGGVAWQAKKSRLKKRIRDMADQLIKIAAQRLLRRRRRRSTCQPGLYEEFAARFPYDGDRGPAARPSRRCSRTCRRARSWTGWCAATSASARPRWRCAPPSRSPCPGRQVAVVVPTTLLSRQHFKTFTERFSGLPLRIRAGLAAGLGERAQGRPRKSSSRARSISSSARMRCSPSRSSSRIWACSSSTRSSTSASPTRSGSRS